MTETANNDESGNKEMPLIAHIAELRRVLIRSGCALILCAIPCGYYWKQIFDLVVSRTLELCKPLSVRIIYTAPAESVMLSIKIALICGLVFASPIIFQQAWSFVSPALYKREKLLLILLIVLVLFGAKKIPELARGLGNGLKEFRKATKEIENDNSKESSSVSDGNSK